MTQAGPVEPAQLVAFARQAFPMLDRMSYYQLLRIAQNADMGAVRAAYYRMAAQLHPDRTVGVTDPTAREQLETIYARMTEGYRVLTSPEKRVAYDKALATGKMRFESTDRPSGGGIKPPEDSLKDAQAKKFFRLGMMCLGRKDFRGAVMNFNFAKTFEPTARVIIDKLAEAQAGMKAGGAPPK